MKTNIHKTITILIITTCNEEDSTFTNGALEHLCEA